MGDIVSLVMRAAQFDIEEDGIALRELEGHTNLGATRALSGVIRPSAP